MTQAVTSRPSHAELIVTACRRVSDAMLAVEGTEPTPLSVVHVF